MDWLGGYYTYRAVAGLVTYDGVNFKDAAGNSISVPGSGESNTASNVGVGGIGVVNGKVGVDLQFRNIIAKSSKVAVTLDATDKEVELDIVEANLSLSALGGAIDLGGAQASGTLAAARMPAYSGDVTSSVGGTTLTVAADAVTNAKLANMAAQSVKVNATSGAADPTDLALAVSSILGRGPTGNIDDLLVGAGLVITNTTIGRAAITGDVSIGEDTNTSVIGANKILTAMIAANQVSNAKLGQMNANTLKGNSTGSIADCQNITLLGGLTMVSGAPGALKSKGSPTFPCTFSTTVTMSDPGTDGVRFNNATLASVTQIAVSASLGGRDLSALFDTLDNAQIGFISNNSTSTAHAVFNITAVSDNGTGVFYTFTVTPMPNVGSLPANAEELQLMYWPSIGVGLTTTDVLNMDVVRLNASDQLIDKDGVVISGSPSVADYAALLLLDPAAYDGFVVNVQSGLNNAFFASNGTSFTPLNGQYTQERSTVPGDKFVVPDGTVTWTAANNGSGKVRLTSSAAHGISEADAEGSFLWLISGGTGWTAMTAHRITPATGFISTTQLDLDTNYTASMGVPVFAKAGTTEALSEVRLLNITLPALRANSEVVVEYTIEYSIQAGTGMRKALFYLDSTLISNNNVTATNTSTVPYRHGIRNQNNVALQRGLVGGNGNGYATNTDAPTESAIATGSGGNVIGIRSVMNNIGMTARVGAYSVFIRG